MTWQTSITQKFGKEVTYRHDVERSRQAEITASDSILYGAGREGQYSQPDEKWT